MENELYEVCDQLRRDAGGRKVIICSSDGDVTVHAGEAGAFDDETGDAVASVVADVLLGAAHPAERSERSEGALEDVVAVLPRALSVCAAPLGQSGKAALVVIYDNSTSIDRVRAKMRRARDQILKILPADAGKGTPKTS